MGVPFEVGENATSGNSSKSQLRQISVPAGAVAMVLLLLALPSQFPYQGGHPQNPWKGQKLLSLVSLRRVDFIGAILLLSATVLLVCALEEAGIAYQWSSALVITFLVIAGLLWILFPFWERYVTNSATKQEPVFPWRFMKSRVIIGMLL